MKPGYKQSEGGVIPQDWDAPELGHILKATHLGGNYKNTERETSWPLIKMGNLDRGTVKLDKLEFIDPSQPPSSTDRLRTDDVLFNTRNTLDLVGKVALWRNELPEAYFNSNIMRMEFDEARVSSKRFMNYILNTSEFLKGLRSIAIGTTSVAAIYGRHLVKLKVPLPSKVEQEAIAEALSDADALIESLGQLLAKKRQLKQGAMQELLTGKKRLPGFTGEWVVRRLEDVCYMKSGQGVTSADIDEFSEYPCYGGNGLRGFSKRYTHNGSYALIGRQGALCGNVLSVDERFFASEHAIVVTPQKETDIHWLSRILARMDLNQYSESSAQPGLSVSKLLALECIVPRLPEQTAIAAILSDMDAEIVALEAKLAKARQLKQGMMQELLTGRIRLV